jgi:ribonucleoside-diphosphate reductase alpha subunit
MKVKKRNGTLVRVRLDEITDRIASLSEDLDSTVIDPVKITIQLVEEIVEGISTSKIDTFAAGICHDKSIIHPHFNTLAGRLAISDHHKNNLILANMKFSQVCHLLYHNKDQLGEPAPLINEQLYELSQTKSDLIDNMIDYDRDFLIDYFGFQTLLKSYLIRIGDKIVETPQHLFMRVALGIWGNIKTVSGKFYEADFDRIKETYDLLSTKHFCHATPTLYNAGTCRPQLFSCYLLGVDDNLESIFKTLADAAQISKWSGGLGIHTSSIRANGSYIRKTGGKSDGIVPMYRVYNETFRYINQGGRRPGSCAMYLEPWHADIEDFLRCKLNHGDENKRARDLFYALWIPDLFMKRVKDNSHWSLMCPSECPGLNEVYGDEFDALYEKYESEGRVFRTVRAQDLFNQIVKNQIETGTPYMLYKDAVNKKSNQKNIGTIRSSNLCAEILEYSDTSKYACCVLASIVLPTYVEDGVVNYEQLYKTVRVVARNLNRVIDINYYPVPETEVSNMSERPIGIGVQGLQDVFYKLGIAYDSDEALKIDKYIHETIYYAALSESCELAKQFGPYATYEGSPFSQGKFQFDLWAEFSGTKIEHSGMWDWEHLRSEIKKYGVRNSLVTALMPTASTSQIMGSASESFEPMTSNCYTRRTKAGEHVLLNPYMANDLIKEGLWNENMRENLLNSRGSLQNFNIPQKYKDIYKTVWELKQKVLIDHSLARGIYIDQSQSLNLYYEDNPSLAPLMERITKGHFYGWENGIKTGCYYTRSKPAANSVSFTVTQKDEEQIDDQDEEVLNLTEQVDEIDIGGDDCSACGA